MTPANNLLELREQIRFCAALAHLSEDDLIKEINRLLAGMRRVNTKNSNALADIVEAQLAEGKAQHALVHRLDTFKTLALWLGQVRVGWL